MGSPEEDSCYSSFRRSSTTAVIAAVGKTGSSTTAVTAVVGNPGKSFTAVEAVNTLGWGEVGTKNQQPLYTRVRQ